MKKLVKWIGGAIALLVVVLLMVFLYVNNGGFIQRHVLPKVSTALGANVTAKDVDFSLFSGITLHDLTVGEADDPLVTAQTVRVAYQFWPLLSGDVMVDEVLLENAVVDYREDKLPEPPVDDASDTDDDDDSAGKDPGVISLKNIKLVNATVRIHTRSTPDAPLTTVLLEKLNVTIPSIGSASDYSMTVDGWLSESRDGKPLFDKIELAGTIDGGFDAKMAPTTSTGTLSLTGHDGGAQPKMAGRVATLNWDVDVSDPAALAIRKFAITETSGGTTEASVNMTGGVTDGVVTLALAVDVVSMEPLRLAGITQPGMDLGKTKLNYDGTLTYEAESTTVASAGILSIRDFTVADSTRGLEAQAPMDMTVKHTLHYGPTGVSITSFDVDAAQGGRTLVAGKLSQPMTIDLANPDALDSASASLGLTFTAVPLTLLAPIMPPTAPAIQDGVLDGQLSIDVIGTGKSVAIVGNLDVTNLDLLKDGTALNDLAVQTRMDLLLVDGKSLSVKALSIGMSQAGGELIVSASVAGDLDLEAKAGELTVNAQVNGAPAQPLARQYVSDIDLGASQGVYRATVTMAGDSITSKGVLVGLNLAVTSESMKLPQLDPMNLNAEHDLSMDSVAGVIDVRTLNLTIANSTQKLATVTLEKPAKIIMASEDKLAGNTSLTVNTTAFPMGILKPFMPAAAPVQVEEGDVTMTTTIDATDNGRTLHIAGNMSAPSMTLRQGETVMRDLAVTKDWDLTLVGMNELTIADVSATITQASTGGHMLTTRTTGKLTLSPMDGSVTLTMNATGSNLGPIVEAYAAGTSLGDATVTMRTDATFSDAGKQVDVDMDLKVAKLNPANAARGTKISTPLDLAMTMKMGVAMETELATISAMTFDVADGSTNLVKAMLNKPYQMSIATVPEGETPPPTPMPDLSVDVTDMDLARLSPLLPDDGDLRALAGRMTMTVRLSGQDDRVFVKSDISLKDLVLHGVNGPTLTEPVNLVVAIKANGDHTQMYTLDAATMKLSGATSKASLLDVTMKGNFDGAFEPRQSSLTVTATQPIDGKALEALLAVSKPDEAAAAPAPAPQPATVPVPQSGDSVPVEAGNLPPIWAVLSLSIARIDYGDVYITDYRGDALLKDNILLIENSSFKVNDTGSGNLVGRADLHDLMMPTYTGKLAMNAIPVQPFVSTFLPKWKVVTSGGLKSLNLDVSGRGRETMDVKKNLTGTMGLAVDRIQVVSIGGKSGQIFEQVVLQQLGITTADILFTEGTLDGTIGGGRFNVGQLLFLGPKLKITSAGQFYDFVAEPMDYDIRITPYITKASERQLPKFMADLLQDQGDGWYKAEEWPFTPKSLSTDGLTNVVKNIAVKKAKAEGTKRLNEAVGDGVGDAAGKALEGDVGGAVEGILGGGLLNGGKKKKPDAPAPAPAPEAAPEAPAPEAPAPAPKDDKQDAVKGLLDRF